MRIIATCSLLTLLAISLTSCLDPRYNRRYEDSGRYDGSSDRDPDCRDGRGRVDMNRWQAIVDDFVTSSYRGKREFQRAKRQLLSDLDGVRDRACGWERRRVERMWAEVRDYQYRDWD